MNYRMMLSLIGGLALCVLTACAESLHQSQRLDMLAYGYDYEGVDFYSYGGPAFYNPGFWGDPFGYYSGFYGPGYGYGYPYWYYPGRSFRGLSAPFPRPAVPANAPRQFLKRR